MCNKIRLRHLVKQGWFAVLLCGLLLGISGCSRMVHPVEVTGYGAPEYDTANEGRRLAAMRDAREDAWTKLYDVVREQPLGANAFLGDRLVIDERLRARVLNSIWNATVLRQHYDPETETAYIVIRYDLDRLNELKQ